MRRSACQWNEVFPRARLLDRLAGASRFAHVRAPAGFGKSILLDQFEAQLRRRHKRPVRIVLSAHGDAERSLLEEISAATELPRDAGYRAIAEGLESAGKTVLLIDKADRLTVSPGACKLLEGLSEDLPKLKIVLASRGEIDLPLARYAASGELLQIGAKAMLFDSEEQEAALEPLEKRGYSSQQLELVAETMAGWPFGLGLQTRLAMDGFHAEEFGKGEPAARLLKGTWRLLDDYFEQEVMPGMPGELKSILAKASILETLTVDDCRELFGQGGEEMLHLAYRQGAPLWPGDPEHNTYRILPVFRQFLLTRLGEKEAADLREQASELLERRQDYHGASVQALHADNHARAAGLLERQMQADFGLRDETRLLAFAELIDREVRDKHARILLAEVQFRIFRFEFETARKLLAKARAIIEDKSRLGDGSADETRSLEMLLLHREMILALGQYDLSRAQDFGDRLLSDMEGVPPMQRVMLLNSLIYAQQELYIFRGAERYYAQAKKLIPLLESWIWSVPLETFYARHLFQTGRTGAAIDLLSTTLARLAEELGPRPIFGAIAAMALAEIKFETDATDETEELLKDYGDNIENFGFLSLTIAARITQARLHMARGEFDAGFAVLERPAVSASEMYDKLFRSFDAERIYWLLKLGREDAARLACSTFGLSLGHPPDPHSSAGTAEEAYATAWIQLARHSRRIVEAIQVAQKWQRYTEGVGAVRSNVRWHVILASLRTLAEEPGLAMRHLRRAIKLGAGGNYRAAFLAEADVINDQLAILTDSDLEESETEFVRSLLGRPKKERTAGEAIDFLLPLGTFSSREIAILRLVAKGRMNREIGVTLGMTEGTVKWYLHKIYDMLGIRRRSQIAMLISQWHMRVTERGGDSPFGDVD